MDWTPVFEKLSPLLTQALAIIVPALLAWMAAALSKGNKIAATQAEQEGRKIERDELNSALRTGAKAFLSVTPNADIKDMVAAGLDYAKKVTPETMSAFEKDTAALREKAHARALEARQETVAGKR